MKITAKRYKELFRKKHVSWQSIVNNQRVPIPYHTTKHEKNFMFVQYATPEEIIVSIETKMKYAQPNLNRFRDRWIATIARCKELITNDEVH